MKKVKLEGKLTLNKEKISTLNEDEMNGVKGGWTGSIGVRCTQPAGGCTYGTSRWTKGWACNKDIIVYE